MRAVGALAAATAVRLPLQPKAVPVTENVAAPEPVDPGPDLAVTGMPDDELGRRGIARLLLGELAVREGRIVAADPLVTPDRPAFERLRLLTNFGVLDRGAGREEPPAATSAAH